MPIGHISLLTGKTTSGKLTVAYKLLAQAQSKRKQAAAHGWVVTRLISGGGVATDEQGMAGVGSIPLAPQQLAILAAARKDSLMAHDRLSCANAPPTQPTESLCVALYARWMGGGL